MEVEFLSVAASTMAIWTTRCHSTRWLDSVSPPAPGSPALWRPDTGAVRGLAAISAGEHALVVAPTGSGKTLAAFLHSLDKLANTPSTGKVRVLYISPLKALAVDVERNLRVPPRYAGRRS